MLQEFSGRSTRQRRRPSKTARVSLILTRILRTLAGRSTCQGGHPPKTARGFAIHVKNPHGASARVFGHAGSAQRVRQRHCKLARRCSKSAPTHTKPAKVSLTTLRIHTAPQRQRCDTHVTRKGCADDVENTHGATAIGLRPAKGCVPPMLYPRQTWPGLGNERK